MLLECADNFNVVVWLTLEMQLKQQAGLLLKWLQELGPVSHQELQFWVLQPSWSEQTNKQEAKLQSLQSCTAVGKLQQSWDSLLPLNLNMFLKSCVTPHLLPKLHSRGVTAVALLLFLHLTSAVIPYLKPEKTPFSTADGLLYPPTCQQCTGNDPIHARQKTEP